MIAPRYLKFSTSSSLCPFILISLWKLFGLFVITFVLSGPIPILYLVVVVSRRSTRTQACIYDNIICKAEVGNKSSFDADTTFMQVVFFGSVITRDWVHVVGHSPVFQILLQIEVRMSTMASPPAWTNSAGMLSTPADFPIFSALAAAYTSSRRIGWCFSSGIWLPLWDNFCPSELPYLKSFILLQQQNMWLFETEVPLFGLRLCKK